jgi:hypothetical protein
MSNITPSGIFDTPMYGANGVLTPLGAAYRDGASRRE